MSNIFSKQKKIRLIFCPLHTTLFKSTTSRTYLCKCMFFKVVNKLNPIGSMKSFKKPNCKLRMKES